MTTNCCNCHQPEPRAVERNLAGYGDWMSLAEFAAWGETSTEIAKRSLDELGITYNRLGPRGQYRISTASVAEHFGVPNKNGDEEGSSNANHQPILAAVAPIPEGERHGQS